MANNGPGRPVKDLEYMKDIIQNLYLEQNMTALQVVIILAINHDLTIRIRALHTILSNWQFTKCCSFMDAPELKIRISTCFYLLGVVV
jgi:transposase